MNHYPGSVVEFKNAGIKRALYLLKHNQKDRAYVILELTYSLSQFDSKSKAALQAFITNYPGETWCWAYIKNLRSENLKKAC